MKDQNKEGNEDDLIDKAEFRRLMEDTFRPLKIQITNEMVDWNFAQIDHDNSGRISFDEYMKFIKKYNWAEISNLILNWLCILTMGFYWIAFCSLLFKLFNIYHR